MGFGFNNSAMGMMFNQGSQLQNAQIPGNGMMQQMTQANNGGM